MNVEICQKCGHAFIGACGCCIAEPDPHPILPVRICPSCGVKGDPVDGRIGWMHIHKDGCMTLKLVQDVEALKLRVLDLERRIALL